MLASFPQRDMKGQNAVFQGIQEVLQANKKRKDLGWTAASEMRLPPSALPGVLGPREPRTQTGSGSNIGLPRLAVCL